MIARWFYFAENQWQNYEKKIDSIRILLEYNASMQLNEY